MTTQQAGTPGLGRRTLVLVIVAALLAAPALVLRLACAGRACDEPQAAAAGVPFCSLPDEVRRDLVAGYRDGRPPDVLAVSSLGTVVAAPGGLAAWPSPRADCASIPVVLSGFGVRPGRAAGSAGLDDIAPTIATIIGLERPHPEVRSGRAVPAVASGERPRLVVIVLWKGVDPARLRKSRVLRSSAAGGVGFSADPKSAPLDPAALAATLGTGAVPRDHGITGRLLRSDDGEVVRAWSRRSPVSVVAALGDDLDEVYENRARIGLVSDDGTDRGLIGGSWYLGQDDDDVTIVPGADLRAAVRTLLSSGYGRDRVPDLVAVAFTGAVDEGDATIEEIVTAARRASADRALVVVAALPRARPPTLDPGEAEDHVEAAVGPVVERVAAGGIFLDQDAVAARRVPEQRVAGALLEMRRAGRPVFADAFSGVAVSFDRYC